eukprot:7843621-Lingulodinium_polyedra.AAC.1
MSSGASSSMPEATTKTLFSHTSNRSTCSEWSPGKKSSPLSSGIALSTSSSADCWMENATSLSGNTTVST